MENSERLKALQDLNGKSFELNKTRFDVYDVRYYMGKYTVYANQQTFVKDDSQFETFLRLIKLLDTGSPVKKEFMPNREKITLKPITIMDAETTTAVTVAANNASTVNDSLLDMFKKLSNNPTEADYKQAEAMSKMANTIISASQMQVNILKLKIGK